MNKQIVLFFIISFLAQTALSREYMSHELFTLSWAADKENGIPYSIDPEGIVRSFSDAYVDKDENIYFSFFAKDFRKYNSSGKLIFAKDIYVDGFTVDDSLNIYFTEFDKKQIVKLIDENGNLTDKQYHLTIDRESQNVQWIKNISGNIFLGFSNNTMKVMENALVIANSICNKPFNADSIYFDSETSMKKISRLNAKSYQQSYVNIYRFNYSAGNFIWLDTLELEICRSKHQAAELLQIDKFDYYYIWLFYGFGKSIELVELDSNFKEIERIEIPINIESMGAFISRPFITNTGNIYEFRAQKDGLHVIRWSKKE